MTTSRDRRNDPESNDAGHDPGGPVADLKQRLQKGLLLLGWKIRTECVGLGFQQFADSYPAQPPAFDPIMAEDLESHLITIAATGKGKGRSALIPTLLTYPGSVVVVDPKREAYDVTHERRRALGHEVVIIDPFPADNEPVSGGLNPFDVCGVTGQPLEDFAVEAANLLHHGKDQSLGDPFWDIRGDGLNAGLIAAVASVRPREEQNFLSVRDLLMSDDTTYNLAVLLDTVGNKLPLLAKQQIASYLQTEDKCRSGILATAAQHVGVLYGRGVEESLTRTTFDLAGFRDGKPTTIYLVIPPQKLQSHGALLRLWVGSLLSVALSRSGRPEVSDLFLLDEAAHLGELEGLRALMTLMRGYGVRCWSFWQDLAQLKRLYRSDWETIVNNASIIQTFGITGCMSAKAMTELFGERISQAGFMDLPIHEQYLLQTGAGIARSRKLDYLHDPIFAGLFAKNPRYETGRS